MICPECGGVTILERYEIYCSSCGLVVDNLTPSLDYSDRLNYPFKQNALLFNKEHWRFYHGLSSYKGFYPEKVIARARELFRIASRMDIEARIDKLCRAAVYIALKENGFNPIRLSPLEKEIARKLLSLTKPKNPMDQIRSVFEEMSPMVKVFTSSINPEEVYSISAELHGKGYRVKNAVAAAMYFSIKKIHPEVSLREFAKRVHVAPGSLSRALKRIS